MNLIKKGAEGDIYKTKWLGKDAVLKIRRPKAYRNTDLDERIRRSRTIKEAQSISRARSCGVLSPLVYFMDTENVLPYTDKGVIKFPWQIVIVTAKNP